MAADGLLLVSRYGVPIGKVHVLRHGLVQEDEVAQLVLRRVQVHLVGEPRKRIRGWACLAWQVILLAVVVAGVNSVNT